MHLLTRFLLVSCLAGPLAAPATEDHALDARPNAEPKPLRYEQPVDLAGSIYAGPDHARLLYRFTRKVSRSGSRLNVVRDYTYPDGRLAARERALYEGDLLVRFELEELQIGAGGSAVIKRDPINPAAGAIEFSYVKSAGGHASARHESLERDTLANDMVAPFLVSHWPALLRGEKVKCRLLAISRRETVGFTFVKTEETIRNARPVVIIRMEPTSPILRTLLDSIFFTIEKESPHRVLEYAGRTTPKQHSGSGWKDLDAVTVFDWK